MAVWSTVTASNIQESFGRFDAEFYRPENLEAFNQVTTKNFEPIARLATDGYRVVYENTKILPSERVTGNCPIFLQATNISANGLAIDFQGAGYVSESDWNRYPKGRIQPGELLIEVKGQAEKVAIVPQDINERVLVSGSLFKLSVDKSKINPWYVFAYFSTKHGKLLRDRLKTNTLIGFVSKPQLYSIPVFIPDDEVDLNQVATFSEKAFWLLKESEAAYTQAQQLLESELGLDKLRFDKPVGYTARFSELESSLRFDPEHFYPTFKALCAGLPETVSLEPLYRFAQPLKTGIQPTYLEDGACEVINSKHIGVNKIDKSKLRRAAPAPYSVMADNGDVLLNATGRGTLGRCAVLESDTPHIFDVCIIRIRPVGIDPYFLSALLNTRFGQLQMELHTRGTSGQLHLYPRDARKILIWPAPESLQTEVRELMTKAARSAQESTQLLDQAKSRVEQLIEEVVRA